MKRMILGTLMCVILTTAVSAQQDTIAKRDFRGEGMRPGKEMRDGHMRHQHMQPEMREGKRGEVRGERPDFKAEGRECKAFCGKDVKREQFTPEQHAEAKTKFLTEKLTLTKKQSEKLQKVFLKESEAFLKLKAETEGQDEAVKKEEFKKLKANTDKQVKKILTEEEFAKYQELGKARKGHGKHRHHILPKNHPNHPGKKAEVADEA
ncbi:MAG: hypothetical protein IJ650_06180 [Paludibacteraceae bacterium]|nr:hypothetical protein [Paludibacteraceae bacterium]